jgi:hypothetical protein
MLKSNMAIDSDSLRSRVMARAVDLGQNMRMIIYRLLSIVLIMDLIAIVYFLSVKYMSGAYASFTLVATILLALIILIRCKCGC